MLTESHGRLVELIWDIANRLRGPYRPPQYRRVMLPLIVLRRLDMVLADSRAEVYALYADLQKSFKTNTLVEDDISKALHGTLLSTVRKKYGLGFYNLSKFDFPRLLADSEGLAQNLVAYIHGFSENIREIFEKFKFEEEIATLDAKNRLYGVMQRFADPQINLHPSNVSNLEMGYIFEHLIRRFNEQANEEAGDHFTPREVITLMSHLIFTDDEDVYRPHIARTIYDPACGTGGMLSVSEAYIKEHNPDAHLTLYGQDYNDESWAICCSDMLIKGESANNIAWGDTLGDGKTFDCFPDLKAHYMLANPPFGVEWKVQEDNVSKEHENLGFNGRFGPGLPRINDGSLLFLLHMLSKRQPNEAEGGAPGSGSKIAIVFNGSPLFNGEAGGGESNIRRWIIENDWLDAIIALPDQLFYNTGIYTYIWLVTNRKAKHRRGKVQLIDATRHYQKMKKSLGNKRNELSDAHIDEIARIYADFKDGATSMANGPDSPKEHVCSKIFDNNDFAYLKLTVERPLRLRMQVTAQGIESLKMATSFINLAISKKKDAAKKAADEEQGRKKQQAILDVLESFDHDTVYMDRAVFEAELQQKATASKTRMYATVLKDILNIFATKDPKAEIARYKDGSPEPDADLRDTEIIPLPKHVDLPLPLDYADGEVNELLDLVRDDCEAHLQAEIKPHWPDAWLDLEKTKVGYEIPLTRHFYEYVPPRGLDEIDAELNTLEAEIADLLQGVAR